MRRRRSKQQISSVEPPQELDADGWRIEQRNERDPELARQRLRNGIERRVQSLLRTCEQAVLKDRYFPAAMDALRLCLDHNLPLPDWLGKEVWANLVTVYAKPRNAKQYEVKTRWRAEQLDRWDTVREFRDRAPELTQIAKKKDHPLYDFDARWDHVFDQAARALKTRGWPAVSGHTVRDSYRKVQKAFNAGEGHKFYIAKFGVKKSTK